MLRASACRVLRMVEAELSRQGGGVATVYTDQIELCGSRRVWRPAMAEIHALGLAEIERFPSDTVPAIELLAQDDATGSANCSRTPLAPCRQAVRDCGGWSAGHNRARTQHPATAGLLCTKGGLKPIVPGVAADHTAGVSYA